jgi:hypothetical protein
MIKENQMEDKPNSNHSEQKRETPPAPVSVGGDYTAIQGNVIGSNLGRGSLSADYIAAGDIVINNGVVAAGTPEEFLGMLSDLRALLEQAREKGEIDPAAAKHAIQNVESTAQLVQKEKKPPKPEIVQRLDAVIEMIDTALDKLTREGSVGSILLKTLPVAVMLVKIAAQLF